MLIDTHLHLFDQDYDVDKFIENAKKAGVEYLIVSGCSVEDNKLNNEMCHNYDNVYISCGFHPDMCETITDDDFSMLEDIVKNNDKVVAIGEIGLDYHYGKETREKQIELFKKQLDLATSYNLPVVIHTRDAFLDTYNILKEYNLKGVIHCFSGSLETAKQYIDLGYYLGIGGVVTFKNSNLKDVLKQLGIEKIVFETDSPFLSPYRGEKNESCNVRHICDFVADYLNLDILDVEKITTSNARGLFDF